MLYNLIISDRSGGITIFFTPSFSAPGELQDIFWLIRNLVWLEIQLPLGQLAADVWVWSTAAQLLELFWGLVLGC
jgi:hypothetical protein